MESLLHNEQKRKNVSWVSSIFHTLKPGFHMIVRITLVVSKYFETMRKTGVIGSFHMIVSTPQRQETQGCRRCLWVTQQNFCACFANKPHKWMIFICKANLVPWYLLFLLIFQHWHARIVPRRHGISSKTWCHGVSLISNNPIRAANICLSFAIVWVAFPQDRPDRLNIFWDDWNDWDDPDYHMETRLNRSWARVN